MVGLRRCGRAHMARRSCPPRKRQPIPVVPDLQPNPIIRHSMVDADFGPSISPGIHQQIAQDLTHPTRIGVRHRCPIATSLQLGPRGMPRPCDLPRSWAGDPSVTEVAAGRPLKSTWGNREPSQRSLRSCRSNSCFPQPVLGTLARSRCTVDGARSSRSFIVCQRIADHRRAARHESHR